MGFLLLLFRLLIQRSIILPHIRYILFALGFLFRLHNLLIVLSFEWYIVSASIDISWSFTLILHERIVLRFVVSFRVKSLKLVLNMLIVWLVFGFLRRYLFLKSC